jgi:lipopolysaccharide transport system permease protein
MEIIRSRKSVSLLKFWGDIWRHKEFLYALALRDVKVRYKYTSIGVLWVAIQLLLITAILTLVFGTREIFNISVPYPLFFLTGIIFWNFFASSVQSASRSLSDNRSMIQKMYFPKILLPIASLAVPLIDFLISCLFLTVVMIYYALFPSVDSIAVFLASFALVLLTTIGISIIASSLSVRYRDVKHSLPLLIQILFFATPVLYPNAILGSYQWITLANPLGAAISAWRESLFLGSIPWGYLAFGAVISSTLLIVSLAIFRIVEQSLADIV